MRKPVGGLALDGLEIIKANNTPIKHFGVIGERCSGTNLAQFLLNRNLPIELDGWGTYGWKHGFPHKVGYDPSSLLVVLFRDPVTWLKSLYRKPWHATVAVQKRGFSEFIRSPWETRIVPPWQLGEGASSALVGQPLQYDRHPIDGKLFQNPVLMRNVKNMAFLGMAERGVNIAFVRMESLIEDPLMVLSRIAIAFDLPTPKNLKQPQRRLGQYNRIVPLPAPPLADLPPEDLGFIADNLDSACEARLGYHTGA